MTSQHSVCLQIEGLTQVVLFSASEHEMASQFVRSLNGQKAKRFAPVVSQLMAMKGDKTSNPDSYLWAVGFSNGRWPNAFRLSMVEGSISVKAVEPGGISDKAELLEVA